MGTIVSRLGNYRFLPGYCRFCFGNHFSDNRRLSSISDISGAFPVYTGVADGGICHLSATGICNAVIKC
ncbi:hypothetical protein HMPREF2534_01739 [Bacteroides thetaiotaomicron]|nr:hypothetical protein HMPREF2534_01739 [Bacteroides thetaiotaomicron]